MSKTIAAITDASTFSVWKQQSNALATHASKAVTMTSIGTPGDDNVGNVALDGNLTLAAGHTITVDNIIKSNASQIKLQSPTEITGDLTLDSGNSAVKLQLDKSGTNTWSVETDSTHSYLQLHDDVNSRYLRLSGTEITTSGYTISSASLPANIANSKISATGTGANGSSFADCDINAGIIVASKISSTGTGGNSSDFTEVDINGGAIDGTVIGGTAKAAGSFTTIEATSTITASGGVTGNVTGTLTGQADTLSATGITAILSKIYPVGSLYITAKDENPYTTLGVGSSTASWVRYGEGRTIVGFVEQATANVSALVGVFDEAATAGVQATLEDDNAQLTLTASPASFGLSVGDTVKVSGVVWNSSTAGATSPTINGDREILAINSNDIFVKISGVNAVTAPGSASLSTPKVKNVLFDVSEETGGSTHKILETKHMAQHIHTHKRDVQVPVADEGGAGPTAPFNTSGSYFTINDINDVISTANDGVSTHRADGPDDGSDAHYSPYGGRVVGDETAATGLQEISIGKPHPVQNPYIVTYMWKRVS